MLLITFVIFLQWFIHVKATALYEQKCCLKISFALNSINLTVLEETHFVSSFQKISCAPKCCPSKLTKSISSFAKRHFAFYNLLLLQNSAHTTMDLSARLFDQVDVLTMNLLLLDYEMCRGQKNNEKHGKEQLDMQRKKGIFCKIMIPDHVIFE
jgi:hypothetical protein